MDFSKRQADPRRHLAGITFVILFHAFIVYALVTGLAKKVVDVVRAPIETKVIEEIKKPPPPPEVVVPPPPRLEAPPPPFIPPPEVQIQQPPPQQPTITVQQTPPPAPQEFRPTPPPAATVAPAAPKPAVMTAGAVCTKTVQPDVPGVSMPVQATILVSYTIQGGKVTKMDVIRSSIRPNDRKVQRLLLAAIEAATQEYVCPGDFTNIQQEFVFNIN
jgi:protein TonB